MAYGARAVDEPDAFVAGGMLVKPPVRKSFDLVRYVGAPANTQMATPVPYFGSELVHPDVVYCPNGWQGFRYWMAVTPYPNADSTYENPSLYASNDGQTWVTPPGASNPIVPYPGGTSYNRDPDLVDGHDGKLYLFYSQSAAVYDMRVISTANGSTWTDPVICFGDATADEILGSPGVVFDGKTWTAYYVDLRETVTKTIRFRTAPAAEGPWSKPTVVGIAVPPSGKEFWHLDAILYGNQALLLITVANAHSFGGQGDLYLAWSSNGLHFTLGTSPVLPRTASGWNSSIYRSTFLPLEDSRLAIWYSANGDGWHLGYTEATQF